MMGAMVYLGYSSQRKLNTNSLAPFCTKKTTCMLQGYVFALDIMSSLLNQLSLFKVLHRDDDIKYTHPSLQQLTYQCHYPSINKLSHTYGRSGENMAKYYNDPSLLKPFTVPGTATSASLVCFYFYIWGHYAHL